MLNDVDALAQRVRLSQDTIKALCTAFRKIFGDEDELWLFGSRARLDERGGDIDIYIRTFCIDAKDVVTAKLAFLNELFYLLEEQRVDVVIQTNTSLAIPIYGIARKTGVRIL